MTKVSNSGNPFLNFASDVVDSAVENAKLSVDNIKSNANALAKDVSDGLDAAKEAATDTVEAYSNAMNSEIIGPAIAPKGILDTAVDIVTNIVEDGPINSMEENFKEVGLSQDSIDGIKQNYKGFQDFVTGMYDDASQRIETIQKKADKVVAEYGPSGVTSNDIHGLNIAKFVTGELAKVGNEVLEHSTTLDKIDSFLDVVGGTLIEMGDTINFLEHAPGSEYMPERLKFALSATNPILVSSLLLNGAGGIIKNAVEGIKSTAELAVESREIVENVDLLQQEDPFEKIAKLKKGQTYELKVSASVSGAHGVGVELGVEHGLKFEKQGEHTKVTFGSKTELLALLGENIGKLGANVGAGGIADGEISVLLTPKNMKIMKAIVDAKLYGTPADIETLMDKMDPILFGGAKVEARSLAKASFGLGIETNADLSASPGVTVEIKNHGPTNSPENSEHIYSIGVKAQISGKAGYYGSIPASMLPRNGEIPQWFEAVLSRVDDPKKRAALTQQFLSGNANVGAAVQIESESRIFIGVKTKGENKYSIGQINKTQFKLNEQVVEAEFKTEITDIKGLMVALRKFNQNIPNEAEFAKMMANGTLNFDKIKNLLSPNQFSKFVHVSVNVSAIAVDGGRVGSYVKVHHTNKTELFKAGLFETKGELKKPQKMCAIDINPNPWIKS